MTHFPRRSIINDGNAHRFSEVFWKTYPRLLKLYRRFLSASSPRTPAVKVLKFIDSTPISLFSDILKCLGLTPCQWKEKRRD